ncbi:MAG: phage major capsid protein, partial [Bacteroidia bacterium]|nr:phage major capsid protein [Bacteroidia bacterium]
EEAAKGETAKAVKGLNDKIAEMEKELKSTTTAEAVEALKAEFEDKLNKLSADIKKQGQISEKRVSPVAGVDMIKKSLEASIKDNAEALRKYRSGTMDLAVKAITPASFDAADYPSLTTQLQPVYRNPYAPVYLRNIFPNISTSGSNVTIWKQGAVTGAAAIWARGTGTEGVDVDKPEVTPTWEKEVVSVDWIAGITHIQREVLDDVDFMATEIPYALIYGASGILAAENKMIMDYIAANNVDYATPLGATAPANSLETVLAAAFGQLGDSYMAPTHILINNWDYLNYMAFNKASGSGEYDYPSLNVQFVNNQLYINNLQAVPVPSLAPGTAYVIAADHSRFISRMGIQTAISQEHSDNFTKNMVTYRAEVRSGFFTYNDNSIIKVTLPTPAVAP